MANSDSEVSFESADEFEVEEGEKKDSSTKEDAAKDAAEPTEKEAEASQNRNQFLTSRTKEEDCDAEKDADQDKSQHETKNSSVDESQSSIKEGDAKEKGVGVTDSEESDRTGIKEGVEEAQEKNEEKENEAQIEPAGEEMGDRGASAKDAESDAREGGAPQHASASEGSGGWGGWGGWGSSLLTSAAASVAKVSDNVGKGLTSVLENVETSLGVPKPEELTNLEKQEAEKAGAEKEQKQAAQGIQAENEEHPKPEVTDGEKDGEKDREATEVKEESGQGATGLGGFLSFGASALTNVVGKTVTGGLDALEMIGRKTMDILQEGDPRLENKRALLLPREEKTNLSAILRQAKEDAEAEAERMKEEEELQKYNFGMLFDQHQGLAHLEALEMLSNQSETGVQSSIAMVMDEDLEELKTELMEVRDSFQLEEMDAVDEDSTSDQDFVNVVTELLFSLSVAATPDKLQRVQKECREWLINHPTGKTDASTDEGQEEDSETKLGIKDVHAQAMKSLAVLTARTIEQFHKVAELMLLDQEREQTQNKSLVESATTLSKLASILSAEISSIATKFCELLSSMADQDSESEEINGIITNIYLEASNSTSYIQDAFQLLLPVLQDIAVRRRSKEEVST